MEMDSDLNIGDPANKFGIVESDVKLKFNQNCKFSIHLPHWQINRSC
jgi:hypothetical protein